MRPVPNVNDWRSLHPKEKLDIETPTYLQVFEQKNGFMSNLSALDVFFNLGVALGTIFKR